MRTISEALSTTSTGTYANQIQADPASQKSTPEAQRVSKEKLEAVYRKVGLVFNSVNKTTQLLMSGNMELNANNTRVESFFVDFLDNVGEVGGERHWKEIQEQIFRYQQIYGEAFVELVPNSRGNKIVDLSLLDPKSMDYAKESEDTIALDEYGNPLGYVQQLPNTMLGDVENVYEAPDEVTLKGNQIYFPRDKIAHYKLYTVGEGFYGIGLIEPTFLDASALKSLKEDYADKAHSTLFPMRYAQVGDETHEPTPEKMKEIKDQLVEAKSSTVASVPDYVDLDILEASHPEELLSFLNYFEDNEVTGMGIPKPFATGSGEEVNRATLDKFNQLFELTLRDIVDRTMRTTERQIFKRIAEEEGFDEYPDIQWGEIGVEEQVNKAERLIKYVDAGILDPDDERVQKAIKKIDGL